MSDSFSLAESRERILGLVDEQRQLFMESELVKPLRSSEVLLGKIALSCVESASLQGGFPAKVMDNPRTDTMSVFIDKPTVIEMVEEHSHAEGLTEEDIVRLYVGTGFANLLILHSLANSRKSRIEDFLETLSEPLNLYNRTMEVPVFDDSSADETVRRIVTDGHEQTARVNAQRLRTGMFIEVQENPKIMRGKIETTFQRELQQVFDGKPTYLRTVGLFDLGGDQAENVFANSSESVIGLAFPMKRGEVKSLIGSL